MKLYALWAVGLMFGLVTESFAIETIKINNKNTQDIKIRIGRVVKDIEKKDADEEKEAESKETMNYSYYHVSCWKNVKASQKIIPKGTSKTIEVQSDKKSIGPRASKAIPCMAVKGKTGDPIIITGEQLASSGSCTLTVTDAGSGAGVNVATTCETLPKIYSSETVTSTIDALKKAKT